MDVSDYYKVYSKIIKKARENFTFFSYFLIKILESLFFSLISSNLYVMNYIFSKSTLYENPKRHNLLHIVIKGGKDEKE